MSDEAARVIATIAWLMVFALAGWMLHEWFAKKLIKNQQELIDYDTTVINNQMDDLKKLKEIIDAQEKVHRDQVNRIDQLEKDLGHVSRERNHVASQLVDAKMARDLELEALKNELVQYKEDNDEMQQDLKDTSKLLEETTVARDALATQLEWSKANWDTLMECSIKVKDIADLIANTPRTDDE